VASSLKLLIAMKRLTRPSFSLPATYMRQLYIAMVLSKIRIHASSMVHTHKGRNNEKEAQWAILNN
jgi:hypothetical protein